MVPANDEVTFWLRELASGSDEAANQIWDRYFQDLVRLAGRKLAQSPRGVTDKEDVALSALKSFILGMGEGRFKDLSNRRELWNLLLVITARKAYKQIRKTQAEQSAMEGIAQVLGGKPTAEMAFLFAETCREMLEALQDEKLKQVAEFKLEGYTNSEIAEQMKCAMRTVERKLERIRKKWHPDARPD